MYNRNLRQECNAIHLFYFVYYMGPYISVMSNYDHLLYSIMVVNGIIINVCYKL